jgi:hypothetical protein
MHFLVGVALEAAFSSLSVRLPDLNRTISFRVWLSKEFKKNPSLIDPQSFLYTISGSNKKMGMSDLGLQSLSCIANLQAGKYPSLSALSHTATCIYIYIHITKYQIITFSA